MPKRDRAGYMRSYRAKKRGLTYLSLDTDPSREPMTNPTQLVFRANGQAMTQAERDAILRKVNRH